MQHLSIFFASFQHLKGIIQAISNSIISAQFKHWYAWIIPKTYLDDFYSYWESACKLLIWCLEVAELIKIRPDPPKSAEQIFLWFIYPAHHQCHCHPSSALPPSSLPYWSWVRTWLQVFNGFREISPTVFVGCAAPGGQCLTLMFHAK